MKYIYYNGGFILNSEGTPRAFLKNEALEIIEELFDEPVKIRQSYNASRGAYDEFYIDSIGTEIWIVSEKKIPNVLPLHTY